MQQDDRSRGYEKRARDYERQRRIRRLPTGQRVRHEPSNESGSDDQEEDAAERGLEPGHAADLSACRQNWGRTSPVATRPWQGESDEIDSTAPSR
jgi:hypothetical protein